MKYLYFVASYFFYLSAFSQVGINTNNPSPASVLDVESSNDGINFGGFLPPRVDAAGRTNIEEKITASDDGLMIYFEDTRCLQMWNVTDSQWEDVFCMPTTSSNASDLFISEYIEGTGNNKAVEIANFTGTSVNLSNYDVQIYFNGSTSAGFTLSLSGSLANGEVFVIAHSSANTAVLSEADLTDSNFNFNGNDAVVFRKNSTNLDVLEIIGNSNNFGSDVTLRKKSGVEANAVYTSSDYNSFPLDTYNGLGSHTY